MWNNVFGVVIGLGILIVIYIVGGYLWAMCKMIFFTRCPYCQSRNIRNFDIESKTTFFRFAGIDVDELKGNLHKGLYTDTLCHDCMNDFVFSHIDKIKEYLKTGV